MELGITTVGGKSNTVFFNVGAAVGPQCPNQMDDVMLVQYLFRKLGQANVPANGPELVKKMAAVTPNGTFDQTTADCILSFQKHFGGTADGRVSAAKGASYGNGTFTIWKMNYWVRGSFGNVWPRLQDFPDCPPLLRSVVPMIL